MCKRELFRPSLRDLACGSAVVRGSVLRILVCCLCFGYPGLCSCVSVCLDDRTVRGLDLVFVGKSAGCEFDFIDRNPILGVVVRGEVADILGAQTCIV